MISVLDRSGNPLYKPVRKSTLICLPRHAIPGIIIHDAMHHLMYDCICKIIPLCVYDLIFARLSVKCHILICINAHIYNVFFIIIIKSRYIAKSTLRSRVTIKASGFEIYIQSHTVSKLFIACLAE